MPTHDPRKMQWPGGMPESLANTLMLVHLKDGWEIQLAEKTISVRKNADNTLTISSDTYKESIGLDGKTPTEVYEAVKFAIICQGFDWTDRLVDYVRSELIKMGVK